MGKRPVFIDLRGTKYFESPQELEAFKKYMEPYKELSNKDISVSYFADETVKVVVKFNEDDEPVLYEKVGSAEILVQGEYDKLYIDDAGEEYRWDGDKFIAINDKTVASDEETNEMLDHIFGGL